MEEKLFLHIDKETCQPGDTIWFRGFLTDANQNKPVDYSRYIYVEIFDRQDSVYIREKIERSGEDSLFLGCITIPENLQQGEYFLRSYTYYMQNQEETFYDTKRIRVINPFDHRVTVNATSIPKRDGERELQLTFTNAKGTIYENLEFLYRIPGETQFGEFEVSNTGYSGKANITIKDSLSDHILIKSSTNSIVDLEQYIPIPHSKRDFHINFMPEGGKLIANAKQRIGVKSIGRDGLGLPVSGTIVDENGKTIAEFHTNNLGMGSFEIESQEGKLYSAITKSTDGRIKRFQLPTPSTGYAIRVERGDENIKYTILHSKNESLRNKELLVISRGILLLQIDLNQSPQAVLSLNDTPEGILNFRLVDKQMNTYSERLIYNHKNNRPKLNLITPYELTGEHESETVTINLENVGDIVSGNFSISITNNRLNKSSVDNCGIDSYLLLKSDLKGHIENPNFYFPNDTCVRIDDLDNLMLTQGWREFNIPSNNSYYMERGQFISGSVENFIGKSSAHASITMEGSNGIVKHTVCDENGKFIIDDIFFREGTQFTIKAQSKRGRNNQRLTIDNQEFRKLELIIPEASFMRNNDYDFYKMYSKTYIYTEQGIQINTLGEVSIRKTPKQIEYDLMVDSIEKRNRNLFHLGITDIKSYGSFGVFETPWEEGILINNSNYKYSNEKHQYNGYQMYPTGSMMETYSYYQLLLKKYSPQNYIESNMKATRPHYNFKAYGFELPKLLGVKYDFMSTSTANIRGVGIFDYFIPYYEIEFNTQTITPLAPQLSEHTTFYQPHYNVDKDLMNIVDEKITRYWNPNVKLSSDSQLNITFPRAKLDDTYTITVNGITDNGTPIHLQGYIE
ncbi:MAG: hypothetical protein E7071_01435 [Bacteroidales bacterium]|nr:hypothetical protein [Bacteroidales bacterium]